MADKLQGLAGTSGAQVALSIQDQAQAHWSVLWAIAGANSWTLTLSAMGKWEEGGQGGERQEGYKWRRRQALLDLQVCPYSIPIQLFCYHTVDI